MDQRQQAVIPPAQWVRKQLGGARPAARALGINSSQVARWGDRVPTAHQARVLEVALERGLDITAEDLIRGRAVPQAVAGG